MKCITNNCHISTTKLHEFVVLLHVVNRKKGNAKKDYNKSFHMTSNKSLDITHTHLMRTCETLTPFFAFGVEGPFCLKTTTTIEVTGRRGPFRPF